MNDNPRSLSIMKKDEHRRLDDLDRLGNKIAELSENLQHRLSLDSLNLMESYEKGNLNVVVSANVGEAKLLYIFAPMPSGSFAGLGNRSIKSTGRITHLNEIGVFIDHIKIVKDSEETS